MWSTLLNFAITCTVFDQAMSAYWHTKNYSYWRHNLWSNSLWDYLNLMHIWSSTSLISCNQADRMVSKQFWIIRCKIIFEVGSSIHPGPCRGWLFFKPNVLFFHIVMNTQRETYILWCLLSVSYLCLHSEWATNHYEAPKSNKLPPMVAILASLPCKLYII